MLLPGFVLLPLSALVTVLTAPGRLLGDVLALRSGGASEDLRAFSRGAGWFVGTLLVAALGTAALLVLGHPFWALAVLLGLPLLLPVHVRLRDHLADVRARVRTFLLLAGGSLVAKDLLAQRHALAQSLDAAGARLAAPGATPDVLPPPPPGLGR
jgi:hypothetical protein